MTREDAQKFINALVKIRDTATDAQASSAPELYPTLKANSALIKAGTRINYNGTIKRAAVDLYDTAESTPEKAPTLWEDIAYKEGYRIIAAAITAGTAFVKDERGWWEDKLYISLIDSNVWTPADYPAGWQAAE